MRQSPQAQWFKEQLPEEWKEKVSVSFDYRLTWSILTEHLTFLYGKYADPEYCLQTYYNSDEYKNHRQVIRRCPDLPTVDMEDIRKMLSEEDAYAERVRELLTLRKNDRSEEETVRAAFLLGLLPEENPDALYRYLIARKQIPEEEKPVLCRHIAQNGQRLSLIVDILAKTFVPGFLLEFPAAGCVMTQPRGRYYYRGENAYFRTSRASAFRRADKEIPEPMRAFIDRLRLYQCWETLDGMDAVRHWGLCEVNYMALAQHYGFRTQMLDITSDLKTALFFACCRYGKDRKWHPLTNEDFAHRNSRKRISAQCGGDSRYGVIYRSPSEITDLRWCIEPEDTAHEIVIPVGYQPFMRCSRQHGYMMLTYPEYDLLRDRNFDKFRFRLTEELCRWIYEKMGRGEAVYPDEDVPDISAEMERLNTQRVISRDVFEKAAEDFRLTEKDRRYVIGALAQYGITLADSVSVIEPEKLAEINRCYTAEYAVEKTGIRPQMSPLLTIS